MQTAFPFSFCEHLPPLLRMRMHLIVSLCIRPHVFTLHLRYPCVAHSHMLPPCRVTTHTWFSGSKWTGVYIPTSTSLQKFQADEPEAEPIDASVVAAAQWVQSAVAVADTALPPPSSPSSSSAAAAAAAAAAAVFYSSDHPALPLPSTPVPPPNGNRSSVLSSSYTHIGEFPQTPHQYYDARDPRRSIHTDILF